MSDKSEKEWSKGKVASNIPQGIYTKENFKWIRSMDSGNIRIQTALFIKEIGFRMRRKEKGRSSIAMEIGFKELLTKKINKAA